MRRLLALTLCFLLITADLLAKSHDWTNLETLKPGDSITITLKDGKKLFGEFQSVNATVLRMAMFTSSGYGFGSFRDLERDQIRKVVRINHPNLPDPAKVMAVGAVIGGTAGAIAGGVRAPSNAPKEPSIILGGFAGALLGGLGGAVVGLGIGVHSLAHRSTVIYESK